MRKFVEYIRNDRCSLRDEWKPHHPGWKTGGVVNHGSGERSTMGCVRKKIDRGDMPLFCFTLSAKINGINLDLQV